MTPIAPTHCSNPCDVCNSDLQCYRNLASSEISVISSHRKKSQILEGNISDPFGNLPTLDRQLAPYVPNGRYRQDRIAIFNIFIIFAGLRVITVMCDLFFAILCIYIGSRRIFQEKRNVGDTTLLCVSSHLPMLCALHTLLTQLRHRSSRTTIISLGIPSLLRLHFAHLGTYSGRIFAHKSAALALFDYHAWLRFFRILTQEHHCQLHLQSLSSNLAWISHYLITVWTAYILLFISTTVARKSQYLIASVRLVIGTSLSSWFALSSRLQLSQEIKN